MTVAEVRSALASLAPTAENAPLARKAAVAAVVRAGAGGAELLFIHRAEHPLDPWSGHVAFPGGRVDPGDASTLAAAIRETREELSLDLERDATLLGRFSEVRTHRDVPTMPRAVAPFAFELNREVSLMPNREVRDVVWVPLEFLLDRTHRSSFVWHEMGVPLDMPCYTIDGRVLWGLTLRVVDELLGALQRP